MQANKVMISLELGLMSFTSSSNAIIKKDITRKKL